MGQPLVGISTAGVPSSGSLNSPVTGFSSNLPPAPVPVTTGKEMAPKAPVAALLPPETRWGGVGQQLGRLGIGR